MHGTMNIKYYDLFSQILCLKNTMKKRTFFVSDVSSKMINYGRKEYNNKKCTNIVVKCVGPYSLHILVATGCVQ